jgi:hypothetical protein
MHINHGHELDRLIAAAERLDARGLDRLQAAINRRRDVLKQSTVLERRDFRNGILQLESRAYRRKKDGGLTKRGPYWYFHYREGGKQRTLYVGKTDDPEAKVIEGMEGE